MNSNNFGGQQHFTMPQSTSFYDSLLSLEKFIDKKHAFDDFAHLVFKAPLFEDLISVVTVYTQCFGPMTDREIAMVQKRMYQLNRQTVRAMHEIINQKQLMAGMSSIDGMTVNPDSMSMNMTPLQGPSMRKETSPLERQFEAFNDVPTTMLNTPLQTPNGPERYLSNKPRDPSSTKAFVDFTEQSSLAVQELLRMQHQWSQNLINNASSMRTPETPLSMNSGGFFAMTPPSPTKAPNQLNDSTMKEFSMPGGVSGNVVDDCGKLRSSGRLTARRRLRSETALLDI